MSEHSTLKLGGSSLAQSEVSAEVVFTHDPEYTPLIVVSAVGKNKADPNDVDKTTDWLIVLEDAVAKGDNARITEAQDAVVYKNRRAFGALGESTLDRFDDLIYKLLSPANHEMGYQWVGEHASAQMFAELTDSVFLRSGLRSSRRSGLLIASSMRAIRAQLRPVLQSGRRAVIEGFVTYDIKTGLPVCLPRGGSDTTGVVYSGALTSKDERWFSENYTDKDGIYSADPDLVPAAEVIPFMTHEETRENMHGISERNGVIHGDAIAHAFNMGVEVVVSNTFNPEAIKTHIVEERSPTPDRPVIGISGKDKIAAIDVHDMGMADAVAYLSRVLTKIGRKDLSISAVPTGEDRSKVIFSGQVDSEDLHDIEDFIRKKSVSGPRVEVDTVSDQGAVYVVGQELSRPSTYTEMIGRVATILAKNDHNMHDIISHQKSPSLAFTVDGTQVPAIIKLLHGELIKGQTTD